jgi:GT2 family glycosyltransferase
MIPVISASIVVFKNKAEDIESISYTILNSYSTCHLFIINNNPNESFKNQFLDNRITYIDVGENIGFGAAHNIGIKLALDHGSLYHFIVNPDVSFTLDVIPRMIDTMNSNQNIGLLMPAITNKDGSIQNLPKLLPTPFSLFARKINSFLPLFNNYISDYEMRNLPLHGIFDVPIISGCFSVISRTAINKIGMFDHRYFLYFEDWDLSRRVTKEFRTAIDTSVRITHNYNSDANKSLKLFFIFLISAVKYFNKWGFIFDIDRVKYNRKAIDQLKNV